MNNDLISREALKRVITANHYLLSAKNNSTDYGMFTTGIMQAIDNALEVSIDWGIDGGDRTIYARPQGGWVPVSERLPDKSGLYLISVDDLVTVANFTGSYFMRRGGYVEVDAWQPLLEPYKKGGAE